MGFDNNVFETGLNLRLGFSPAVEIIPAKAADHNYSSGKAAAISFEPSLTLGLVSGDKVSNCFNNKQSSSDELLYRQDSGTSSFSNVSVKRDREQLGSEETENTAKRVISDEDDDGSNGRKKLRLTKAQSALLEESFKQHSTLNPKQKQQLAKELNLRPRQVEVWFQNRRARTKLKQTEVDCEYLKKCCGTLTDENRRLQKEVQELKALKVAQPLYLQVPAATLTMCPSCERVGGSGNVPAATDDSSNDPFPSIPPKPNLYNSFSSPSTAC